MEADAVCAAVGCLVLCCVVCVGLFRLIQMGLERGRDVRAEFSSRLLSFTFSIREWDQETRPGGTSSQDAEPRELSRSQGGRASLEPH